MKIGVITHWWCFENYGQILQGYAFQQFLKKRGHSPFIIRYKPFSEVGERMTVSRILRKVRHPLMFCKNAWMWCSGRMRFEKGRRDRIEPLRGFNAFRAEYMVYNHHLYRSAEELMAAKDIDADVYSVGSDVVWKYVPLNDQGKCFFLQFGRKDAVRISYSPSFGNTELSDEYKKFVSPLLKSFTAISVREPSGVKLCAEMGRRDAVCVLDPVFLLTKEEWEERFCVPNERRGVFGYFLANAQGAPVKEMKELPAAIDGLKIVTVYGDMNVPNEFITNPTIQDWIRFIGSAEAVVTNSFHGTSMAIIFQTPFVVCLKEGGKAMDDRVLSLVERLGLADRVLVKGGPDMRTILLKTINWEKVQERLQEEITRSKAFLSAVGI